MLLTCTLCGLGSQSERKQLLLICWSNCYWLVYRLMETTGAPALEC